MTSTTLPMSYVDVGDLKAALQIEQDDKRRDDALASLIQSASRSVDDYCNRYFGQVGTTLATVARIFEATRHLVIIDDLVTLAKVEYRAGTDWVEIDDSLVELFPLNSASEVPAKPYTWLQYASRDRLPAMMRLTGIWGWPDVPQPIKDATLLQSVRLMKSKDVPLGVVGGADMMGTLRLASGLHPDAAYLCQPFQRVSLG